MLLLLFVFLLNVRLGNKEDETKEECSYYLRLAWLSGVIVDDKDVAVITDIVVLFREKENTNIMYILPE